jgi:membrane-associated phospholipid phosphatase
MDASAFAQPQPPPQLQGSFELQALSRPWDLVSLASVVLGGYPAVLALTTGAAAHAWFALGVAAAEALASALKRGLLAVLPAVQALRRPRGACDCDVSNGGGCQPGAPGMPSGHMAVAAFVLAYLWLAGLVAAPPAAYAAAAGALLLLLAVARVRKRCHTPLQVAAGTALGAALAAAWARVAPL